MRMKAFFFSGLLTAAAALLQAQNLDIVSEKQQTWKVGEEIPFTVSDGAKEGVFY